MTATGVRKAQSPLTPDACQLDFNMVKMRPGDATHTFDCGLTLYEESTMLHHFLKRIRAFTLAQLHVRACACARVRASAPACACVRASAPGVSGLACA